MATSGPINFSQNRSNIPVLVVHANGTMSNQIRQTLKNLGFTQISAAPSHIQALDRFKTRNFSLVIFDASESDMPQIDFIERIIELDPNCCLIPVSASPRVDDIFSLLRSGARAFLVVPFTADVVESVLRSAAEGPPLSDSVLNAPDRNAALIGVVLNNLYRLSVVMRQAREFSTAAREVERMGYAFAESIELARLFSEGGDDLLVEKIVDACIQRANTAATRLGRTRKKLRNQREKAPGSDNPAPA